MGDERTMFVPSPTTLYVFGLPHPHKVPSVLIANPTSPPIDMLFVHDVPGIWTGDEKFIGLFTGTCPSEALPHPQRVPSVFKAIV